ncbi:MAG: amidohydrolase [Chloroflexi bacterium]|nr:amidohydrolase [Chloroflexota bacterium]
MIIDFHTHIFPPAAKADRSPYLARDACFGQLYSSPKAKMATAEDLVASMDLEGIDVSVALNFGWADHALCVETNNYILESIARYPKRIVGFCAVQPAAGDKAIYEMERCARAGVRGIGEMRSDEQGFHLGDEAVMGPVVHAAKRLGLILLLHSSEPVGHEYKGKGKVTPEQLYSFAKAFAEATVVYAHWGGGLPFYALMPEVALALQHTYFDTAASPLLYRPQIFKHVVEIIGADKVLFGSDYPLLPLRRYRSELDSLGLDRDVTDAIFGGNAQRLLGIEK